VTHALLAKKQGRNIHTYVHTPSENILVKRQFREILRAFFRSRVPPGL
jgi:hypothetical protein